ncbi:energy-coupling factor ABC transporter ATP-binding protein [Actinotalea sp. M2MS4P-6]|uniref:energy-coupling factor ABC transporter ATP-binding protein n=1 Tax=Actinotalea sp. M2MS4P-6 TaxID=2983762 RepID=UPI0021E5106B|nr:ABC transporter ATP-binding protein [Actinotalea sp. M2MS4P-6]MCV2392985.1 energy-coupling factor ABC transporter ATP-binding protein [Actinotalea sp. M2MS4P-6]
MSGVPSDLPGGSPGAAVPNGAAGDRGGAPDVGSPPALDVRALGFAYPDGRTALRDVSLRVEPGERVALLGPNGAGKTTLALHLDGILTPAHGEVRVGELTVERSTLAEVRRRVQLVFQDPDDQLFSPTVRDDVAFGPANLGLRGAELAERVLEALDAVGMAEHADRVPYHLSFGQRRRVAIATVLAMRPDVLVLDEPTSNLDPAGRRELGEILDSLGAALVIATHDLPFALQLCPRSVVLDDGAVVADGPTADLLADADLMSAHRLELPYGFDPRSVPPARDPRVGRP